MMSDLETVIQFAFFWVNYYPVLYYSALEVLSGGKG